MTKDWVRLIAVLLLILIIAGCGAPKEPSEETNNENESNVVNDQHKPEPQQPVEPEFSHAFPLTGEGTDEVITNRPIVVMVENSPSARPQSGLHQADIVYEILAEGEITRFVAVYQSEEPEVIGPVRSIRPYFVEIGDNLDALVVHAGWSQEAKNMLVQRGVQHFDAVYGDHPYYWRSKERVAPHNLYTSIELILDGADAKGYRTDEWDNPGIVFADNGSELQGEPANKVTIPYLLGYEVTYEYDSKEGRYIRWMAGEKHADKESEEQLFADNIIIGRAGHHVLDSAGRRQVDVNGPGEGYYLRDGKMVEVTWEHVDGMIRVFQDGEEIPWKPGKTWIHLVPVNSAVTFE